MIIHIPTKGSSNEIKSFVVVFIHLHVTLGHIVERHRDHMRLLHDLSYGTTLSQKIVMSLVFPVTEILAIEDHKFYSAFLYVVFGSQSLLKPTSD
jgi:hypothetical protein